MHFATNVFRSFIPRYIQSIDRAVTTSSREFNPTQKGEFKLSNPRRYFFEQRADLLKRLEHDKKLHSPLGSQPNASHLANVQMSIDEATENFHKAYLYEKLGPFFEDATTFDDASQIIKGLEGEARGSDQEI